MLGTNVGRALAASLGYHDTARVLVCGDLFDKEGEYQRQQGLGEYINTSPHPAHVYFAATICGDLSENNEFQCLFDHDKSKCYVKIQDIKRNIRRTDVLAPFYVFREGHRRRLNKITGVCFLGSGGKPKSFSTSVPPADEQPRVRPTTPVPSSDDEVPAVESTPPPAPTSSGTIHSRRIEAETLLAGGSDEEDLPNDVDELDSEGDFETDSGEEVASEHEDDEEFTWQPPAAWDRQVDLNPARKRFGTCVWRSPADRGSVPPGRATPEQKAQFHVRVHGERPFASLFLEALPVATFWREVASQSRTYAEASRRESTTPSQRGWDASKCTVANYLRLVSAVIMRGLCNTSSDQEFFASTGRCGGRYVQPSAAHVCKLSLNLYQQLLRYMHLVDNTLRPPVGGEHHDKLFHVRPIISRLQQVFASWVSPGKNNAMDEAGIPSRFTWLRKRDTSKPHKYFIEVLMACDSDSRFCWSFFVVEGSTKSVKRPNRRSQQSRFIKAQHYQHEYTKVDRLFQNRFGTAPAQMLYFARVLRSLDPEDGRRVGSKTQVYRLFCDRRWDSFIGVVEAMERYDVAYTSTVKKQSRFHVAYQLGVGFNKSKPRSQRGKFRSAITTINGRGYRSVLWCDSALIAYISADLGTEEHQVKRQQGRHTVEIACPDMIVVRGKHFRAVDSHDQLRLGRSHFCFIVKSKPWPKVFFGCIEILLINMYIVCHQLADYKGLSQREFRWKLVEQLLDVCDELEGYRDTADNPAPPPTTGDPLGRHDVGSTDEHHHDKMAEYVSEADAQELKQMMLDNPATKGRASSNKTKKPRRRDANRKDGKVLNPAFFNSSCVVCWARGDRRLTNRYCRECSKDRVWPAGMNRGGGYMTEFHPRLCSPECWDKFHTERIPGLDFSVRKRMRRDPNDD